jgi:hypothetical protein
MKEVPKAEKNAKMERRKATEKNVLRGCRSTFKEIVVKQSTFFFLLTLC